MLLQEFTRIKERDAAKGIRWGLGVFFGTSFNPSDVQGVMFKGEKVFGGKTYTVTDLGIPRWFISTPHGEDPGGLPATMYDRFFLVFEEFGQLDPDTKKPFAEVVLKGGTPPWFLPEGSYRTMLSNEGTLHGVTKDFLFSQTRRQKLTMEFDIDIWLEDFADRPYEFEGRTWQVMPYTKHWASVNPTVVCEAEPKEMGQPWCNARSLTAADRYLQCLWDAQGNQEVDASTITGVAGYIGMGATKSYIEGLRSLLELPSYEAVVADPNGVAIPNRADLQMLMSYQMAGWTQREDLAACITFMQRLPKDFSMTYMTALLRRDFKGLINEPAMAGWIHKNASLVAVLNQA